MFSLTARKQTRCPIDETGGFMWPAAWLKTNNRFRIKLNYRGRLLLRPWQRVIYRQQPTPSGRITIREKYYVPTNPRTVLQQANRALFAEAVDAWQSLDYEQEIYWNKLRYPEHMSGYNRFLRNYMNTHTPVLPNYRLKLNSDYFLKINTNYFAKIS